MLEVTINSPTNDSFSLLVAPNDSILTLKSKISIKTKVQSNRISLIYNGLLLQNGQMLKEVVKDSLAFHFLVNSAPSSELNKLNKDETPSRSVPYQTSLQLILNSVPKNSQLVIINGILYAMHPQQISQPLVVEQPQNQNNNRFIFNPADMINELLQDPNNDDLEPARHVIVTVIFSRYYNFRHFG